MISGYTQCGAGLASSVLQLAPGYGCALSVGSAVLGSIADCGINPDGCGRSIAVNVVSGGIGCIPGAGLIAAGITCGVALNDNQETWVNCVVNGKQATSVGHPILANSSIRLQLEFLDISLAYNDAIYGAPAWTDIDAINDIAFEPLLQAHLQAVMLAVDEGGEGGAVVTSNERGELLALQLPPSITVDDRNAFIDRMEAIVTDTLSPEEWNFHL